MLAGIALVHVAGAGRADVDEAIARCAAIASEDDRIVCLESALRALEPGGGVARRPAAQSSDPRDSGEPEAALDPPPLPEPVPPPVEAAATKETSAAPHEGKAAQTGPAGVELGAEQVAARNGSKDDEESIVNATVVDFDFVGYRRLLVQLDNGQIWRQIDGDRVSVERGLRNEDSFDVEMWSTRLGGYRMRILPLDRTIRVERLQ